MLSRLFHGRLWWFVAGLQVELLHFLPVLIEYFVYSGMTVRGPTTWSRTRHDGPYHLGL